MSDNSMAITENANGIVVHPCVPIRFILSEEDSHRLPLLNRKELQKVCMTTFLTNFDYHIDENPDLTDEQRMEIQSTLSQMSASDARIRHFKNSSQLSYYRKHLIPAFKNHSPITEHKISGTPFITFIIIYDGYTGITEVCSDDQVGTVYACIYTKAKSRSTSISLSRPIYQEDVDEKAVEALSAYGFTTDIQYSSDALSLQLSHFIELARSGPGYFGKKFTTVKGREGLEGIRLSLDTYGNELHIFHELCLRLEKKYSVRITFGKKPRTMNTMYQCLTYIQWENNICEPGM